MCIYVVAYDNSIAEYDESVLIIGRPVNPLDTVNQNTTFLIIDDDGLYSTIAVIGNKNIFLCVGVDVVVRPNDLNITEGGVMEVCVEFAEGQIPAERVVMLSVSETSSMFISV